MVKRVVLSAILPIALSAQQIVINKTLSVSNELWLSADTIHFKRDDAKQVVIDTKRYLMWQDNEAAKTVERDWQGAKAYCLNLQFAGYDDWRLPTIKELESITDLSRHHPAIKKRFENVASDHYWSSSPIVVYSKLAWEVHFNDGGSGHTLGSNKFYVRCVRAGQ